MCGRFVTSNLPFEEWTSVFGSQRLTGALLDRLTHRDATGVVYKGMDKMRELAGMACRRKGWKN